MTKSDKLQKKPPYGDTKVNYTKTKADIERLLNDYGAIGVIWASYKGDDVLQFLVNTEIQGVKKEIGIEVRPPNIPVKKRLKGRGLVTTRNKNQEYRLLFYWIKSKLEAVVWGLSSIEREFLSQVMVSLPDGGTTVGNILSQYIINDQLQALPAPQKDERRYVEVEAHDVQR